MRIRVSHFDGRRLVGVHVPRLGWFGIGAGWAGHADSLEEQRFGFGCSSVARGGVDDVLEPSSLATRQPGTKANV
jgi:hypothetical protein